MNVDFVATIGPCFQHSISCASQLPHIQSIFCVLLFLHMGVVRPHSPLNPPSLACRTANFFRTVTFSTKEHTLWKAVIHWLLDRMCIVASANPQLHA